MLKQVYVGMVDFKGCHWVRISGRDVSKMTGVKGVNHLVLDDVKCLNGIVDFRGVKNTIEFINTDMSKVKQILCCTNCNIVGLKNDKTMTGLIVYEYAGLVNLKTKLIKDYIHNDKQKS